jgi:hypothetical protein
VRNVNFSISLVDLYFCIVYLLCYNAIFSEVLVLVTVALAVTYILVFHFSYCRFEFVISFVWDISRDYTALILIYLDILSISDVYILNGDSKEVH